MSNSKKIASVAFTGAAATATTMLAAGPAFAAVSWHVKNGGVGYTGVVKGKNKAGTSPSLKDTTTGAVLKCKKAFVSGSVSKSHSPAASSAILGFVKKTTTKWSSCTAAGFFHFKAHLTTSANLHAKTYNATTGVTTGNLAVKAPATKISGVISGTSGNTCHATVSGTSVPLKYSNTPHSFNVNSGKTATLKIKSVTGTCFGQLANGNNAYFAGVYHISTPTALTVSRA